MSIDNCQVKDNFKLIDYCPTIINFPSAFSPNGDGVNETFYAKGIYVDEFQMFIFNRWGELLFTANSITDAWDGTYGGIKVEQDVYVWKVLYTEHEPSGINSKKEMIGKVVVLR
jgi:gliding motility-associated-like protein